MADVKNFKSVNIFSDFDDCPKANVTKGYGISFTLDDIDPIAMLNYIRTVDEDAYNALQNGDCPEFSKVTMKDLTAYDVESALEWYGTHFVDLVCDGLNTYHGDVFVGEENMESTVWFILFEAKFPWEYRNSSIDMELNYSDDPEIVRDIISEYFEENGLWNENVNIDDMLDYYNIFRMNCD